MIGKFLRDIEGKKFRFFGTFFLVIIVTYGLLYAIDFIPEAPEEETDTVPNTSISNGEPVVLPSGSDATPDTIIFDSLNKEVKILNPQSADIATLDNALLNGVVRHPDSADLQQDGTMFLFGHSSSLPNVRNKNFQAFNGIQNLEWGDKIRVQSSDFEYVYRVDRVYEAKASTAEVALVSGTATLALATCNSFGTKDDRFIVEATLIDSYPI